MYTPHKDEKIHDIAEFDDGTYTVAEIINLHPGVVCVWVKSEVVK